MNIRNELINEICKEKGIKVEYLSADYILRLTKNSKVRHIIGPYWDINSSVADRIACDKTGCYIMLNHDGIPAIEHMLMYNPLRRSYLLDDNGVTQKIRDYFETNNRQVVAKPNDSAEGRNVFYCDNLLTLEQAVHTIFTTEPDAALCPYHEIYTEYRVFYLNGRAHFSYGKIRGDDWRFNLSQGARAFEIKDANLRAKLGELAVKAAKCININFASIDVVSLENNKLAIMEINSGVVAQHLLEQLPYLRQTIKSIYAEAIGTMFM